MINGAQIRLARAVLRWGVRDLAREAQVSPATITRIEKGGAGKCINTFGHSTCLGSG
jgi:transcriptional regulator with XRE-family HTH domain